jgi:hypothetical protein
LFLYLTSLHLLSSFSFFARVPLLEKAFAKINGDTLSRLDATDGGGGYVGDPTKAVCAMRGGGEGNSFSWYRLTTEESKLCLEKDAEVCPLLCSVFSKPFRIPLTHLLFLSLVFSYFFSFFSSFSL